MEEEVLVKLSLDEAIAIMASTFEEKFLEPTWCAIRRKVLKAFEIAKESYTDNPV